MENTNNQTPARSSEEQLKTKYGGKLYRVGITVPVDDESEKEFSYYFKRPTVPSYDRYIKTAAQGITKASKAFMLDAVIDEDAERLTKDMEENPGIAISIGNKLTEILGLTGTANLKKLYNRLTEIDSQLCELYNSIWGNTGCESGICPL